MASACTPRPPSAGSIPDATTRLRVDGHGASGEPIGWDLDLVLVVVGVRPATELLVGAGAETGPRGAVMVDETMATGLPQNRSGPPVTVWLPTTPSSAKSTIGRFWKAFELKPHRTDTFKLSNDPLFVAKAFDVVGLYLKPPEGAVVLCVETGREMRSVNTNSALAVRPSNTPFNDLFDVRVAHDTSRRWPSTAGPALRGNTG